MKRYRAKGLVLATVIGWGCGGVVDAPRPDLSQLEPQVQDKIRSHQQLVVEEPRSAEAWGRLGKVFHAHAMLEPASTCYLNAMGLDPEEFRWPYFLAHTLWNSDPEESLAHAARASTLRPGYAPALILAAGQEEQLGRPDAARRRYEEALRIAPEVAAVHFGLGRLSLAAGAVEPAVEHLERAAELQPGVAPIQSALAQARRRAANPETIEPPSADRWQPQLAIEDPVMVEVLDEAVSVVGYRDRGKRAFFAGDLERAEMLFGKALEIRPKEAAALVELGSVLGAKGDSLGAEKAYRQALDAESESRKAMTRLALLLTYEPRFDRARLDEAVLLFERVLEADPNDGEAHFHRAVALSRVGEHSAAWEHVEAAEALGEEVPIGFVQALETKLPRPPR